MNHLTMNFYSASLILLPYYWYAFGGYPALIRPVGAADNPAMPLKSGRNLQGRSSARDSPNATGDTSADNRTPFCRAQKPDHILGSQGIVVRKIAEFFENGMTS
jgi:hypothetical protein